MLKVYLKTTYLLISFLLYLYSRLICELNSNTKEREGKLFYLEITFITKNFYDVEIEGPFCKRQF